MHGWDFSSNSHISGIKFSESNWDGVGGEDKVTDLNSYPVKPVSSILTSLPHTVFILH